jgi:hypothetical protein
MRRCPGCGYDNPGGALKCGVCGGDVSGVPEAPRPEKRTEPDLLPAVGLLLLFCAGFFYLYQHAPWRRAPAPSTGEDAATDEASFSYDGVVYSLDRMRELRFLPREDKLRVPPLLQSRDDLTAFSAASALGQWAREASEGEDRRRWFEALLKAAASGRTVPRRQAAMEAAYDIAYGLDTAPYAGELRAVAGGLVNSGDADLQHAGYFLAAMAGLEEYGERMEKTLLYDPSREARLYAACGLARLGRPSGHAFLAGLAAGADPELSARAFDCLAYSSAPETAPYLSSLAAGRGELADPAKRTLMSRKQLAIIKK